MKKVFIALLLALSIGGCALFKQYNNPITNTTVVTVERTYGVTLSAAVAYRRLCADKVIKRSTCGPIVAKLQAADAEVRVALEDLKDFAQEHPQLDAVSLVLALRTAVQKFEAVAIKYKVKS